MTDIVGSKEVGSIEYEPGIAIRIVIPRFVHSIKVYQLVSNEKQKHCLHNIFICALRAGSWWFYFQVNSINITKSWFIFGEKAVNKNVIFRAILISIFLLLLLEEERWIIFEIFIIKKASNEQQPSTRAAALNFDDFPLTSKTLFCLLEH